ncbi:hypothetical protein SAMN05216238_107149 [Lentibacillus persicus]|uniref:Uncharacterized protein n=1 Tax=Lentibacillus persicus TaxID=640948 RepID=A0A1I1X8H9_9BACI|nr:hypothetical protein [Lentibacillus persicus]SFE03652.1 hypothetical protein SAMN05216238_107149 [Lentibacillus persicus]
MEMIERYIYAVTKRLPEAQRDDVAEELRGLIEDMLDERRQNRHVTEADVEDVLLGLGHPRNLARKYRGNNKYLIGPELYDLYILVLKIGLISVVIGFSAVFVIQVILNPVNILDYFINYIVSYFTTIIPMVIGWTTFGFAFVEYFSAGKLEKINIDKEWKPSDLAPIPDQGRQIKRSETIIGITFYVLIIMFLAFSSDYFGIWIFQNGDFSGVVPFLNQEIYSAILLLVLIVFGFGIVKECLKFKYGKWTVSLVVITSIVNLISITLILFMITSTQFWNPDFMSELVQHGIVNEGSEGYEVVRQIWEQMTLWILVLLIIGLVWDIIAGFIKVRKAKLKTKKHSKILG